MLLLLTLLYCGVIWLVFFKFKWLPWNKTSRNAAILVGIVGLLAVLIGLVQGSPAASGGIQIQARVIGLSSRVSGFVTKVHAEPYQTMKKGEPIFEVDRVPYENKVNQLEAQLVGTRNQVAQLDATHKGAIAAVEVVEAEIDVLRASLEGAVANVQTAQASLAAAKSQLEVAAADVKANESNVKTAELQIPRIRKLVDQKYETQAELDSAENKVVAAKAGLVASRATEKKTRDDVAVREGQLKASQAAEDQVRKSRDSLEAQLRKAQAAELNARIAVESTVDGKHTSVLELEQQLATARYDLENTVVRAPSDGYVAVLTLSEGVYVRMMQVGSFVNTEEMWAVATFEQSTVQYIEPEQEAEIAFSSMPGRIVPAVVSHVGWVAGEAQVPPSGTLPQIQTMAPTSRVAVIFQLEDTEGFTPEFSASGTVAVYTDTAKPFSIIRKIILRMTSLLYWLG